MSVIQELEEMRAKRTKENMDKLDSKDIETMSKEELEEYIKLKWDKVQQAKMSSKSNSIDKEALGFWALSTGFNAGTIAVAMATGSMDAITALTYAGMGLIINGAVAGTIAENNNQAKSTEQDEDLEICQK